MSRLPDSPFLKSLSPCRGGGEPFLGIVGQPARGDLKINCREAAGANGTNELHFFLIHEICHAVAGTGHGKKWLTRSLSDYPFAEQKVISADLITAQS